MSLYTKYRPSDFSEIVGNESVVESLKSLLDRSREEIPHAFLFTGNSGCGKTTLGRILANELGCSGMDLTEVDTADFRGIDTIRDIRQRMHMKPMESSCRVWIMDEVQKLTGDGQSAMLKALEDTPPHVYFILCTTDPEKLLPTIRNRCTQYQVSSLTERQITGLLKDVVSQENKSISINALKIVASAALGSPRQALVMLDKVIDIPEDQIDDALSQIVVSETQIIDLCRALVDKRKDWEKVCKILGELKNENPESIRMAVIKYFSKVIKNKEPNMGAYWTMRCFYRYPVYSLGFSPIEIACFEAMFMVSDESE